MASAREDARGRHAKADWRRPSLSQDGSARGRNLLGAWGRTRPDAGGTPREAHPGKGLRELWSALAVSRSPQDHAQKKTAHASEQDRPDIVKRREDWFEGQLDLDPERLVFIDETWASTNMARRYGRAPRGQRLRMSVPHGHWKTTTFVGALRLTGMTAPMVLDGPINGLAFQAYVDQVLVPELKAGDGVVMDMCGRPRRCKKNLFGEGGAWSGADMCPASCCGLSHAAGPYGSSQSGSNSI